MRKQHEPPPTSVRCDLGPWRNRLLVGALIVAALGLAAAASQAAVTQDGYRRFMLAYLVTFAFVLSLGLGALFFVLIQHLTRAGWSVLVRRFPEAMAAALPVVALLALPIFASVLLGKGEVYPWAQPLSAKVEHHAEVAPAEPLVASDAGWHGQAGVRGSMPVSSAANAQSTGKSLGSDLPVPPPGYEHRQLDELTLKKRHWLNPGFFVARWVVFLAFWSAVSLWFWRQSVRQDQGGDYRLTMSMERAAGPLLLLYAATVTLGAFDLLMSLNPHWYSTIYGVYFFSGCVVGSLAALILLIHGLQRAGVLTRTIGIEHQHDLGKLLFAFVFFWAYIGFSQYMLIWYGNLPEEIGWLAIRGASTAGGHGNGWSPLLLVLLFGHFAIPFVGLLSRHIKRRRGLLVFWAAWLLVMHWVDLLWLVMPEFGPKLTLGPIELGLALCLSGVFFATVVQRLGAASLVPTADPRLDESLAFENV